MAYEKTSWQSNVFGGYVDFVGNDYDRPASNAVDGSLHDGHQEFYLCSETRDDGHDPWWTVDLGQVYTVHNVSIAAPHNCRHFIH